MLSKKLKETLKKQHYGLVGKHSGVQICRWTKKSLINEGCCYKEKFYGIKSHLCCQMSPSVVFCQNKCLHCWRAIELTENFDMNPLEVDEPKEIIEGCIKAQKKLLTGFKGNEKIDMKKFIESKEPVQFAISLTGEPTLYPRLGEFITELRKKGKTSFLVTNGLCPDVLGKLAEKGQLPTQLYISLNSPNKKLYEKWHRSSVKNAWKKFNKSLDIMNELNGKTRRVIRMTLVKDKNMSEDMIKSYVELMKKATPDFIEVKGFVSVGFSRKRLGYEMMPNHKEIKEFAEKLVKGLKEAELKNYKILDEYEASKVVLIGKDTEKMRIKNKEI